MIPGYAYQVDLWRPGTQTWEPDGPQARGLVPRDYSPQETADRILRNWTADYPAGLRVMVTIWAEDRSVRAGDPLARSTGDPT